MRNIEVEECTIPPSFSLGKEGTQRQGTRGLNHSIVNQ